MAREWQPLAPMGKPGIWWQLANMIPTRCGSYYPMNLFTTQFATGLSDTATRAWCALYGNDSLVAYIGTATKLYDWNGVSTLTDRSRGGNYTSTVRAWNFAQFGNFTLATNRTDAVQVRDVTAGLAFADIAAVPKCNIFVTQSQQVLAFDLSIGGVDYRSSFATSAPGDHTDWSSASATTNTPIAHRPGKITAAVAFRDYVLVFKQGSVYKLKYTGSATYKWTVELIAIGRGAWSPFDVVHCGDSVVFSGPGGVWQYDGTNWTMISALLGEVPFASSSLFCPISQNVMFCTSATSQIYVYNLISKRWGSYFPATIASTASGALLTLIGGLMFMGDSAALRSLVPASDALPDLVYMVTSSADTVYKSSIYYGNAGYSGVSAYLNTGSEGIGARRQTRFGAIDLDTTVSITRSSDIAPTATELTLRSWRANAKDDYAFVNALTGTETNVTSLTAQHRFNVAITAPYAKFGIVFPYNSGYLEVLDVNIPMLDAGSL